VLEDLEPRSCVAARVRELAYQWRLRVFSFTLKEAAPGGSDKRECRDCLVPLWAVNYVLRASLCIVYQ
jgi:hypothetical protein